MLVSIEPSSLVTPAEARSPVARNPIDRVGEGALETEDVSEGTQVRRAQRLAGFAAAVEREIGLSPTASKIFVIG
jgi:hypothetical protein